MSNVTDIPSLKAAFELRCLSGDLRCDVLMSGLFGAEIAVVAEAPGFSEVQQKMPLAGSSGSVFWTAARQHAGISRHDCYVTNVIKRQVAYGTDENKVMLPRHEIDHWMMLLRWELANLPHLKYIICLGSFALEAVTGKRGITDWRGSVLQVQETCGLNRPVQALCTFNPAAIMREPKNEIVFAMDLGKMKKLKVGEFKEHIITATINPTYKEALDHLAYYNASTEPVSADIEIIAGETACVGFANNAHTGTCISFRTRGENRYSLEEECTIRRRIQQLLGNTRVKKVGQNWNFDASWLWFKDRIKTSPAYFDTMLAHHTLYPALPHNLGFLTTQYTNHPYYKDEKDNWKEGGNINEFWEYNVKDVCLTWHIHQRLKNELRTQNLERFFFEHVMRLQPELIEMTVAGVKVDIAMKFNITKELESKLVTTLSAFHTAVADATGLPDYKPSPKSPAQLSDLFFNKLRLVGKGTSTDKLNRSIMFRHPRTTEKARAVILTMNEFAEEQKFYSTYATTVIDQDDRIRCEYKQTGVQSAPGRLSSSKVMWGSGMNLQNQPTRAHPMYIADDGYCFFYFDLSQAEARVVGWLANILTWKAQFEKARIDGKYDAHRALASEMFKVPYDDVPAFDRYPDSPEEAERMHFIFDPLKAGKITIRYSAKRCRHGLNYRMGPQRLAEVLGISLVDATKLWEIYHKVNPELQVWWKKEEDEVRRTRMQFSPLGRRNYILERLTPEALESIVAFKPQSTIGDHVSSVIYRCHADEKWPTHARLRLNVHDALIGIARHDQVNQCLRIAIKHAEKPILINGEPLIIPADVAISQPDEHGIHRWSTISKIKKEMLL